MKIAVLSGKGGAGKTFVSVNLSIAAEELMYVDCDVEEPNGRIFLKSNKEDIKIKKIYKYLPSIIVDKCNGCRKCTEFCRFNALIYIRNKLKVFEGLCHSCGACKVICEEGAIEEKPHEIGELEISNYKGVRIVTGIMNTGEASGIPIINAAIDEADKYSGDAIIDCPPGSACSVMESVERADKCIIVVEPTAFGFHNFKMVYELCKILKKPIFIIINKSSGKYEPLEEFIKNENLEVLMDIPYDKNLASILADGKIASLENEDIKLAFRKVYEKLGGAKA